MSNNDLPNYPFCLPSYIASFDDGQLAEQELKAETRSWRSEGYAKDFNIQILDHDHGVGRNRFCSDADIAQMLTEPPPQIRFIILLPTVHERVADVICKHGATTTLFKKNELYDDGDVDPADARQCGQWEADKLNISRRALFDIMTTYDIAPAACSHIRGQEQIFGSRVTKDEKGEVLAFEFWYAIRARAYFREVDKDADLKITIVTKYNVATGSTVVLLKYRSFNDLPCKLKRELISKLCELVMEPSTQIIAKDPFAISLLHFNSTAQWYRRAARDPRDSVRMEEEKAHDVSKDKKNEVNAINVRRLHLTMRNLDQDKLQLTFILGVIDRLRKQHELFYRLVKKSASLDTRESLYLRVDEEFNRLENHVMYLRSSIEDVSKRAQRLLDLLFNLSAQQNARWSEKVGKQAMHEGASMRAIAVVSMLFLPGTFISGILGTNLFSPEDFTPSRGKAHSTFRAASQWWILLITIIPLTTFTLIAWSVWRKKTENEISRKIAADDIETGQLQDARRKNSTSRRMGSFAVFTWGERDSTRKTSSASTSDIGELPLTEKHGG